MKALRKYWPFILLLGACSKQQGVIEHAGFLVATCTEGSEGTQVLPAAPKAFGVPLSKPLCTEKEASGLKLGKRLRIIPYKDDIADIEFSCDRNAASIFFRKNAGKTVAFVFGGAVVATARIPNDPSTDRCALMGLPSLSDAVGVCEDLSSSIGFDKLGCTTLCNGKNDQAQTCVESRESL